MSNNLKNKQAGFTLIEMMVAFLILAVGLLGMMSLQNSSIKSGQDVAYRLQAIQLAQDMADRIRANRAGVVSAAYDQVDANAAIEECETAVGCDGDSMAENDYFTWSERVRQLLPNGEAMICLDSTINDGTGETDFASCDTAGDVYAIKLWWYEGAETVAGTAATTADLIHLDMTDGIPSLVIGIVP